MGPIDRVRAARVAYDAAVAEALAGLFATITGALHAGVSAADIAAASHFDADQVTRIGKAAGILHPAAARAESDDRATPQWREMLAAADSPQQRARLERLPQNSRMMPTVGHYDDLLTRRERADDDSGGTPAPGALA